jgi:phosphatidylinositol glycan class F
MSAHSTSQRPLKPQYSPVHLLDTDISRLYTHIHPIIVLSIYFLSFKLIVADPISALSSLLLPLAALQVAYVVICLPPTGSHNVPGHSKSGAEKKSVKAKAKVTLGMRVIVRLNPSAAIYFEWRYADELQQPAMISLLLTVSLGTPLFLTLLVLFGAPMTTHIPHTILLAGHISLLTALPIIYTRGIDRGTWRAVVALLLPIDEVFGAAVGTCIGAWVGAVPIPLDWDREWQRWPITVLTGAYIGWGLGKTAGRVVFMGKVIDLRP